MIVSAVIPLYNKADTIVRAVHSVLAQTRPPDALVVVDDGSTDGSAEACRAVMAAAPERPNFLLIEQTNSGVSVARNRGADAVPSDIIAFLDADDEWLPDHLAELVRLAKSVPDAGILSTRHARLDPTGRPAAEPSVLVSGFLGRVENGLAAYRRGYGILHTSTIAVSRMAWIRSGGFPPGERKSQDIHLWLRLLLSESFAHSDRVTGIWHEEHTGVVNRSGAVPAHFRHFLGTEAGRKALSNPDLVAFLASNLASHVAGHRLRGDDEVAVALVQLAEALPLAARVKIHAVAAMPRSAIAAIAALRRQVRSTRRRA